MARTDQRRLISIILGADTFEGLPSVKSDEVGAALRQSKEGFVSYIRTIACNILDKFNYEDLPEQLCREIADFLRSETSATDLIVYYVGHGGSLALSDRSEYFFALRRTTDAEKYLDGLRASAFAQVINKNAARLRAAIILDCCYSAKAASYFFGTDLDPPVEIKKTPFGVTVFAATAPEAEAVVPKGEKYTMFSGCLLDVLSKGIAQSGEFLSIREIATEVKAMIEARYPSQVVIPQLHSPRQRYGDVADFPLFPNPSYRAAALILAKPPSRERPLNLFVSGAGLAAYSGMAVLVCTVTEDPKAVRKTIALVRERMIKSPVLDLAPETKGRLRERGFSYVADDPDIRTRFLESLSLLTYEAYSCAAEKTYFEDASAQDVFRELFGALLYDRIKKYRTRTITIWLHGDQRGMLPLLQDVVMSCVHRINTTSSGQVRELPAVHAVDILEECLELTSYVAAILRERLDSVATEISAVRRYRNIESKVRLIRRLDTGEYFSRHHPLPH
jgi:hypothetical protein